MTTVASEVMARAQQQMEPFLEGCTEEVSEMLCDPDNADIRSMASQKMGVLLLKNYKFNVPTASGQVEFGQDQLGLAGGCAVVRALRKPTNHNKDWPLVRLINKQFPDLKALFEDQQIDEMEIFTSLRAVADRMAPSPCSNKAAASLAKLMAATSIAAGGPGQKQPIGGSSFFAENVVVTNQAPADEGQQEPDGAAKPEPADNELHDLAGEICPGQVLGPDTTQPQHLAVELQEGNLVPPVQTPASPVPGPVVASAAGPQARPTAGAGAPAPVHARGLQLDDRYRVARLLRKVGVDEPLEVMRRKEEDDKLAAGGAAAGAIGGGSGGGNGGGQGIHVAGDEEEEQPGYIINNNAQLEDEPLPDVEAGLPLNPGSPASDQTGTQEPPGTNLEFYPGLDTPSAVPNTAQKELDAHAVYQQTPVSSLYNPASATFAPGSVNSFYGMPWSDGTYRDMMEERVRPSTGRSHSGGAGSSNQAQTREVAGGSPGAGPSGHAGERRRLEYGGKEEEDEEEDGKEKKEDE